MRDNPGLLIFGFFCLYPMIFAVIGFTVGRYRLRLRSPVIFDRSAEATPTETKSILRKIEERRRDSIGYGQGQ